MSGHRPSRNWEGSKKTGAKSRGRTRRFFLFWFRVSGFEFREIIVKPGGTAAHPLCRKPPFTCHNRAKPEDLGWFIAMLFSAHQKQLLVCRPTDSSSWGLSDPSTHVQGFRDPRPMHRGPKDRSRAGRSGLQPRLASEASNEGRKPWVAIAKNGRA